MIVNVGFRHTVAAAEAGVHPLAVFDFDLSLETQKAMSDKLDEGFRIVGLDLDSYVWRLNHDTLTDRELNFAFKLLLAVNNIPVNEIEMIVINLNNDTVWYSHFAKVVETWAKRHTDKVKLIEPARVAA